MQAIITEQEYEDYKALRFSTNDRVAFIIGNIIRLVKQRSTAKRNRLGGNRAVSELIVCLHKMKQSVTRTDYGSLKCPVKPKSTIDLLEILDREIKQTEQ